MAGNMESLLLGGDDSSSDDEAPTNTTPAAVAAQRAPSNLAATNAPAATAVPQASASAPTPASMSQSEMAQRLKSMYSPATKAPSSGPPPAAAMAAVPPGAQPSTLPRPTQPSLVGNTQRPTLPVSQQKAMAPAPATTGSQRAQSVGGPPASSSSSQGMAPPPQQQQYRSGIAHQQMPARSSSVPHQLPNDQQQHRSGSLPPPQQVPRASASASHATQPTGGRPIPQQALPPQQSRSSGMPPQQQQHPPVARRNSHGQATQQQAMAASSRAPTGMAPPTSSSQQLASSSSAPRPTYSSGAGQAALQQPQSSAVLPSSSSAHAAMERDKELKKQKEKFLIFTRVLMKYLEQKDPPLHIKVKAIIKDCAERNRRKEPGYESVTASMKIQLRKVVHDGYWKRAEAYLDHFLKEKAMAGSQSALVLTGSSSGQVGATPSSATSSSSVAASSDAAKRRQAAMDMQRQQQPTSSRPPAQEAVQASITSLREDMAKKRQAVAAVATSAPRPTSSSSAPPKHVPPVPAATKGKAAAAKTRPKGASTPTGQQQRKTSLSTVTGTEAISHSAVPGMAMSLPSMHKYNELMEQVDHAANFDWIVVGAVLGDETRATITEEQRKLIYDSKTVLNAAVAPEDEADVPSFPIPGWSQRNVVSSRIAWSRLRRGRKQWDSTSNPVVGGGLISLKSVPGQSSITMEEQSGGVAIDAVWYNEEKAEEDEALAVLSEGAEIYIRSVLEKALHCARQRLNLDGIRLWHQQYAGNESEKPSLSLRLGCDVTRQVAQSVGNAAMTCKRMEEALERQSDIPAAMREINEDTLKTATSMSELALRPKLGKAIADAETTGKRNFDVYNGKHAHEPPFGRVPKTAKLEVIDFQTGMNFVRPGRRRHRASTLSSSFFY